MNAFTPKQIQDLKQASPAHLYQALLFTLRRINRNDEAAVLRLDVMLAHDVPLEEIALLFRHAETEEALANEGDPFREILLRALSWRRQQIQQHKQRAANAQWN